MQRSPRKQLPLSPSFPGTVATRFRRGWSKTSSPGSNITGVNALAPALIPKRLELLHEAVPQARAIATLVNPRARNAQPNVEASKTAAAALSEQLIVFNASTDQEIEAAFAELSRRRIGALLVGTDIFLNSDEVIE